MPTNIVARTSKDAPMLTAKIISTFKDAAQRLTGPAKRAFIARVTQDHFDGSARKAESHLGWSRQTIQKGLKEVETGFVCIDNYTARGRKQTETKLPTLEADIHALVQGQSQADPQLRSTLCYAGYPLKAGQLGYDCHYSKMHGMPVTSSRGFRGPKPLWYNGVPP